MSSKLSTKVAIPPGVSEKLYRTKMCNYYKRGEECKYHDKCFFAHGERELRPLPKGQFSTNFDEEDEEGEQNSYDSEEHYQKEQRIDQDLAKVRDELKKLQAEKSKQEFVHNNEITKLREENRTLKEQITRFEDEKQRLEEEVKQAFTQGKRQAVMDFAKMKAKSLVKVGTQTERDQQAFLPHHKIILDSPPAPQPAVAIKDKKSDESLIEKV